MGFHGVGDKHEMDVVLLPYVQIMLAEHIKPIVTGAIVGSGEKY